MIDEEEDMGVARVDLVFGRGKGGRGGAEGERREGERSESAWESSRSKGIVVTQHQKRHDHRQR